MKAAARAWIKKAEGDYETAVREFRARRRPNLDAACFHAQQSVEKYLKAMLTEGGMSFPKIHDLVKLGEMARVIVPMLTLYEDDLDLLSRYAVVFRYPGESATRPEARAAVGAMRRVRMLLREHVGLR
jgi:HEPN domain-containing protein